MQSPAPAESDPPPSRPSSSLLATPTLPRAWWALVLLLGLTLLAGSWAAAYSSSPDAYAAPLPHATAPSNVPSMIPGHLSEAAPTVSSPLAASNSPTSNSPMFTPRSSSPSTSSAAEVGTDLGTFDAADVTFGTASYDPVTGDFWVNSESDAIQIVDPQNDSLLHVITESTLDAPNLFAYDPANHDIYVSNLMSANVDVFNATSGAFVGAVPLPTTYAEQIVYDPVDGDVYVAIAAFCEVDIIQGLSYIGDISLGGSCIWSPGITFDSLTGLTYVSVEGPNYLYAISGSSIDAAGNVKLGESEPFWLSFDSSDGLVVVGSGASGEVALANPETNSSVVLSNSAFAEPFYGTSDPLNGELYFVNEGNSEVVVVSPSAGVTAVIGIAGAGDAAAWDPASGQLFAPAQGSTLVSVVATELAEAVPGTASDGPLSALTNTTTEAGPDALAYDPWTSTVWSANSVADTVSAVSDLTGSVTLTPATGSTPDAIVYDPAVPSEDVVNYGSSSVSVLNPYTGANLATITTGTNPDAAAYDPVDQDVYVADKAADAVSVLHGESAAGNPIPVGVHPDAVAYDAFSGSVLVANAVSGNVTVINATYGSVKANWTVGTAPDAILWSSEFPNWAFVAESGSASVSVLNLTTGAVTATYPVGAGPDALAADARGDLWVASSGSRTVTELAAAQGTVLATVPFSSSPAALLWDANVQGLYVALEPVTGVGYLQLLGPTAGSPLSSVDLGQPYLESTELTATGTTVDTPGISALASGAIACAPSPAFVRWGPLDHDATFQQGCVGLHPGTYEQWVNTTDSSGALVSEPIWTTVNAALTASASPSAASVDVGQTLTYTATPTGGTGSYVAYAWTAPAVLGCFASTRSTLTCAPSGPGTWLNASVAVEDSNGVWSVPVNASSVTVAGAPTIVVTPSALSRDVGQPLWLNASAVGGSGTYTSYLWSGLPASGCTGTATSSVVCVPSVPGSWSVSATLTDSNGDSISSTPNVITVDSDPSLSTLVASRSGVAVGSADVGQTLVFSTVASGGTGTYASYTWTGLPAADCTGLTSSVATCVPTASDEGSWTVAASVTDSNGATSPSTSVVVVSVLADPALGTPDWGAPGIDVGQSTTLSTAVTSTGAGIVAVVLTPSTHGLACAGTGGASAACTALGAGSDTVEVSAEDANGAWVSVNSTALTVSTDPSVAVTVSATSITSGTSVTFRATVTGGSSSDTYTWSGLPAGCSSSTGTVTCAPTPDGSYVVSVEVTDGNGASASSAPVSLTVSAPTAATFLGLPQTPGILFLALDLVLLLLIVVLLVLYVRRGKSAPPRETPAVAPAPSGPAATPPSEAAPAPPVSVPVEEKDQMTLDPEPATPPAPPPPPPPATKSEGEEYSES